MTEFNGRMWETLIVDSRTPGETTRVVVRVAEDAHRRPIDIQMNVGTPGNPLGLAVEALCASISLGLRKGIPLESYTHGLTAQAFAPAGATDDPHVPTCTSVVDYLAKALAQRYGAWKDST